MGLATVSFNTPQKHCHSRGLRRLLADWGCRQRAGDPQSENLWKRRIRMAIEISRLKKSRKRGLILDGRAPQGGRDLTKDCEQPPMATTPKQGHGYVLTLQKRLVARLLPARQPLSPTNEPLYTSLQTPRLSPLRLSLHPLAVALLVYLPPSDCQRTRCHARVRMGSGKGAYCCREEGPGVTPACLIEIEWEELVFDFAVMLILRCTKWSRRRHEDHIFLKTLLIAGRHTGPYHGFGRCVHMTRKRV